MTTSAGNVRRLPYAPPAKARSLARSLAGRAGSGAGLALVLTLVAAAGGGCTGWRELADDLTAEQAEDIGFRLANAQRYDPMELARIAEGRGAEVLVAEDISPCRVADLETTCARLVIRLEAVDPSGAAPPPPGRTGDGEATVEHCYEYTVRNSVDDHEADRVDCPEGAEPLVLPPPPPPTTLPRNLHEELDRRLHDLVTAGTVDEDAVRAAVEPLATGPGVTLEVASADGAVGVAIGLAGEAECVSARIVGGSTVEVWSVPDVVAQPGELGCGAAAAASGLSQRYPH